MTPAPRRLGEFAASAACGHRARRATLTTACSGAHAGDEFLALWADMAPTIASTPAALGCRPSCCCRRAVGGNAVEEERIEQHAVFGGQLRIDALEGARIVGAEIGRGAHAAQEERRCGARLRRCRIAVERRRVTCGSIPRSMSLAPSSRITASVPSAAPTSRAAPARRMPYRRRPRHSRSPRRCLWPTSAACSRGTKPSLFRQAQTRRQRIAERHDLDGRLSVADGMPRRSSDEQSHATNGRTQRFGAKPLPPPI